MLAEYSSEIKLSTEEQLEIGLGEKEKKNEIRLSTEGQREKEMSEEERKNAIILIINDDYKIRTLLVQAKNNLGAFFNDDEEMVRYALASGLMDLCREEEYREIYNLREQLDDVRYMVDKTYELVSRLCAENVKIDRLCTLPGKVDSIQRDIDSMFTMSKEASSNIKSLTKTVKEELRENTKSLMQQANEEIESSIRISTEVAKKEFGDNIKSLMQQANEELEDNIKSLLKTASETSEKTKDIPCILNEIKGLRQMLDSAGNCDIGKPKASKKETKSLLKRKTPKKLSDKGFMEFRSNLFCDVLDICEETDELKSCIKEDIDSGDFEFCKEGNRDIAAGAFKCCGEDDVENSDFNFLEEGDIKTSDFKIYGEGDVDGTLLIMDMLDNMESILEELGNKRN